MYVSFYWLANSSLFTYRRTKEMSFMKSSLLHQKYPTSCKMRGKWPYNRCFMGYCFQDVSKQVYTNLYIYIYICVCVCVCVCVCDRLWRRPQLMRRLTVQLKLGMVELQAQTIYYEDLPRISEKFLKSWQEKNGVPQYHRFSRAIFLDWLP